MSEPGESTWSEITILPDGRVYIFGMTLPLLEALAVLPTRDGRWQALLAQLREPTPCTAQQENRCE